MIKLPKEFYLNKGQGWFISTQAEFVLKAKIEQIGKKLKDWSDVKINRGIVTGLNEAFIINQDKRDEILNNCIDEDERQRTEQIIRPILRGRDIKRYQANWAGLYVIATFPILKLDIENYPAIKGYFLNNFDIRRLEQSGKKFEDGFGNVMNSRANTGLKWFETQSSTSYYQDFDKEKVVWQRITQGAAFVIVKSKMYTLDSTVILVGNNLKYMIATLNSKIISYIINMQVHKLGDTGFLLSNQYVEQFPIPPITTENHDKVDRIEVLVDEVIRLKERGQSTVTAESEIDELVYSLYDLTTDEIAIIKND